MAEKKLLGQGESLWIATTPKTHYQQLQTTVETDVVVIGAGFAGIAAAYFLAVKGKKIVIIDAFRIVTGTSGYTTAKVTSLHGLIYDFLIRNFGEEKAKLYADSNQWAISELAAIVKKEQIDCDLLTDDAYTYTNENENIEKIKKEVEAAKKLGLPATFVTNSTNLPFGMQSAIQFSNQALFNPRKFLLAVANIVVKRGNAIYEQTQAQDIREDGMCEVITEKGKIRAKDVVIATNYPFYEKAFIAPRMNQMRSYAYAVEIHTSSKENQIKGMYLGVGKNELSIRPYREKGKEWLILGGEDHSVGDGSDGREHFLTLQERIQKLFPDTSFAYRWAAQDSSPIDHLPYIGRLPNSQHLYVTTGFDEWGMTKSIVSAKILSDLIINGKNDWASFYAPTRLNIKASVKKSLEMGMQNIKGYGKHLPKTTDDDASTLRKNEGKVITKDSEKIAVYKDTKGQLHAVSAVCTHLGCIVDWNKGEKTWDCPCHGSRFSKEGKVINGPAIKDLAKKDI